MVFGNLFSDNNINNGRQHAFDLCKAVSIILMILCHVFYTMKYCAPATLNPTYIAQNAVRFLGAQFFMFAMGMGLIYSRHDSAKYCAKRGLILLVSGYLLNFVCLVLPSIIIGKSLVFGDIFVTNRFLMLFGADILQFAGLTLLFFAIVKQFKWSDMTVLITTLCITAIGTLCTDKIFLTLTPEHFYYAFAGLIVPVKNFITSEYVCFSFSNWLIYPVTGWFFGKMLKRCYDLDKFYLYLLGISLPLFLIEWVIFSVMGKNLWLTLMNPIIYHQQNPIILVIYMTVIMLALSLSHFISIHLIKFKLWKVIKHMSVELLTLYIASWVVIGWLSAGLRYTNKFLTNDWNTILLVFGFVFGVSELYIYLKNKYIKPLK